MATTQEILAYDEKHVTDDVAKAEAFIKLFFSKEQKPTYADNPEQQLKVITVLAAAQKSIEAKKLKEALDAVKVSIKPYKLLELYEIDSLKQHIHDEGIEVQALFSDEELAAAGYVKKDEPKTPVVEANETTPRERVKMLFVNPQGEVVIDHEVPVTGTTKSKTGLKAFVDYAEKERQILRPVIATMTEVEFKNTFADYIAKVKAQAA
ncbi:hypothetical protein NVV56_09410 [Aeromonas dhakensis]|uniref:hypothetical protein n=1 Tax=Aeromonas dhakensis TaxID=196024 RepID=UPI0021575511|nr:hypothetical protein [Aeromonas dhakensis]MCR6739107.1 hypothetical protein [Aeromonas dhakensis]